MSHTEPISWRRFRDELKPMLRIAIPFAIAQLGLMAMGVVDTMMVGRISKEAMAAVALGNGFCMGLLVPASGVLFVLDPLVSQAFGAGDHPSMSLALKRGTVLAIGLFFPVAFAMFWSKPVFAALGVEPEVVALASRYTRGIAPGVLAFLLFVTMRQFLQAMSLSRPLLLAVLLANGLNILANLALVHGRFGFAGWGAVGSSWATTISRYFMALCLLGFCWPILRPHWQLPQRRHVWDRIAFRNMLAVGIPIGLQVGLELWAFMSAVFSMGRLGTTAVAGHQVAIHLAATAFMVPMAIGMAAATRVGQALGRKDPVGAKVAALATLSFGILFMCISAVLFLAIPELLASAFTNAKEVIAMAALLLPIAGVFQISDGAQVVACGILRGTADTKFAAFSNFVGYWVLGLPIGLLLAYPGNLGPRGIWWGLTIGLTIVAALLLIRIGRRFRQPDGLLRAIVT